MATVYIKNFSRETNEEKIRKLFATYGTVKNIHLVTTPDGRFLPIARITLQSDDEVKTAVEGLNGTDVDGKSITVISEEDERNRHKRRK